MRFVSKRQSKKDQAEEEPTEALEEDVSLKTHFDFLQAFGRSCFHSEPYAWATFHMLIGAMPNIRRLRIRRGDTWLDPRVHVFYLADSGSGKGVGASFVTDVGKKLGLNVYNATDFTDAALIGTIRTTDDGEPIIHKGLLSGQTRQWDEGKGGEDIVNIDILLVSEASKILNPKPGPNDAGIMNSLQIAMNTVGTSDNMVTKKLAEGPSVSYGTDVTLFFTTFLPVAFADVVLKRGLFQRTLMVVKESNHDERVRINHEFFKSFYAKPDELYHNPVTREVANKVTDEIVDMVVQTIKSANRWAKSVEEIKVSKEASERLDNLVLKFQNQIKGLSPFLQAKIHEFVTRLAGHLVKLAAHVAILNHSEIVQAEHVDALENLHAPQRFEDLITYLSNNVEEPKEFTTRMNKELRCLFSSQKSLETETQYKTWKAAEQGWRMRDDLEGRVMAKARLPKSGATSLVERHILYGHIEARRENGYVFCRMNPNIELNQNEPN